ncbi:hypothetical protein QBC47DRAFT_394567 [Echria macrotheca]|uniref:NmrA-like domain-containing protein n=1 Tax=Echria macrotheca TaxID=438768 RepID=A0AAJ0B3E9_9PEZI|nr:hypothetical protein QBC47DRAFT_394567 [Echria macrotheca]
MVVVAVAGGTGNIGRTIVEAIQATGKHEIKILSRKADPALEAELGAPIIAVNYDDVEGLAKILDDNNIHTVVSGLAMHLPGGGAPAEINLIRAADLSKTTRRMISSEWGTEITEAQRGDIPSVAHKLDAKYELEKTKDLEYTRFHNGYFMDYWGLPKVKSHMARTALVFWIDMANNAAALPGTGETPNIFTHTTDIAKFVAASLDLPKWKPDTYVKGDRLTWNQFLRHAEEAKGTKFDVVYDSPEKLKAGEISELPAQVQLYQFFPKKLLQGMCAAFGLWFDKGLADLHPEKFINEDFPDIKPMTVKEMLDKAWKE